MKTKLVFLGLVLGFCLNAAPAKPSYFKSVKGTVIGGLLQRGTFDMNPGTLGACDFNQAGSMFVFKCPVTGMTVELDDGKGGTGHFTFEKLTVFYKALKEGTIHEFHFTGSWTEKGPVDLSSKATMMIYYNTKKPQLVKGWIRLDDLETASPLQGLAN